MARMVSKLLISGDWVSARKKKTRNMILKCQNCLHKQTLLKQFMQNRVVCVKENVQIICQNSAQPRVDFRIEIKKVYHQSVPPMRYWFLCQHYVIFTDRTHAH